MTLYLIDNFLIRYISDEPLRQRRAAGILINSVEIKLLVQQSAPALASIKAARIICGKSKTSPCVPKHDHIAF